MEDSIEVLKAVMSGNSALLNEILQSLNSTERVSVLAAQDYTDKALEEKHVIRIPCKTTPLIAAVQTGNLDCVKVLLNYKADIEEQGESFRYLVFPPDDMWNVSKFEFAYTCPPLFLAAANGNLDILSYLFEQGSNVNASSSSEYADPWSLPSEFDDYLPIWRTPLIVALTNGHNDAFTFLIDKGADVNLQDHVGYTALHHAVESRNFDAVSCLVHNGADVNLFTSINKHTPLMSACQFHNMDAINVLLNKGADVNLQDRDGKSALHFACSDICYWLIQNLADVNMCDNHNCTPLMQASSKSDVKKVAMLVENQAKVDLQDMNGNTALHHAMHNSYHSHEYTPEICCALLTAKASSHLCNSQGWTPLLLASENCIKSAVEILIKHPEVTKEQRANALELLGSSLCLKSGTFAIEEGFSYIKLGMKERFADASHPLLKQQVEPAQAYQNRKESQTLEELAEIESGEDSIIMESLVIRERIIGANNKELLKPIEHVAEHFYSKDPGHFKRLSIPLYRYATKIAQGCIEELFESAVSCLWHLTDVLYECKQYSDRELLLELLELTVFLCENWPDDDGYYQSVWHIIYVEEVSLFDSVEVVIHMITKNLQNGEEDETYSNVLVLLRKLLRHNPRRMYYNGTLLHAGTHSTENIITDIFPSADTVKLLLKAGFNIHAIDKDGNTPLHRAASVEPRDDLIHLLTEIMKALVDGGAHHDFVNHHGKTPMDMAKTDEACKLLSEEKSKLKLKCISARAVKKFGIPYLVEVPKILEKYISMH